MNAPDFLNAAFTTALTPLGAETILVDGRQIRAVLGETTEEQDLMLGGDGDHRLLTAQFPTRALPFKPVKGAAVSARNTSWTIASVASHPLTATTLTLHSPARRTT